MDIIPPPIRSRVMAQVRSHGNRTTEIALIRLLRRHGIKGWRRGSPLRGRPDFVFRARHIAVFVDGCFWHGCPRHCRMPASRRKYWTTKIACNRARDTETNRVLRKGGWHVLRVWEHEIQGDQLPRRLTTTLRTVALKGS
ncbi:MAG: very short patch repair endonuclease [Verrucomicrobiota bacterium]|nr:very short patch repair endonuclease [Verrucomicrobiota bacterium]